MVSSSTSLRLSPDFLRPYRIKGDCFESLLARSTYLTKYCRGTETWTDTIRRVVEGNCSMVPGVSMGEAEALFELFWTMRCLPPGRALWIGGVSGVPGDSVFNCYSTTIRTPEDWCWGMNQLMLGGGVGFSLLAVDGLPFVKKSDSAALRILCDPGHANAEEVQPDKVRGQGVFYEVADSREGWVEALRRVLLAAYNGFNLNLDLTKVRSRGSPLKTFGGAACGPGPLASLLRMVWGVVRGASGRRLSSVECLDIVNLIAFCIKSGNIRRSATCVLGNPYDREFRDAKKDWEKVAAYRHTSNNSIVFRTREEIASFDWKQLVMDNVKYGEPGVLNLYKVWQTDPGATGINPCQPAWAPVLTPDGIRRLGEIQVGDTVWGGKAWTKVVSKWSTGVKPIFRYRTTAGTFVGTANHKVFQQGERVEVKDAGAIDLSLGAPDVDVPHDPQTVMDGLLVGDGYVKPCKAVEYPLLIVGAKDQDYFTSEVSHLLNRVAFDRLQHRAVTSLRRVDLAKLPERVVPAQYYHGSTNTVRSFLRGLYSANGSVVANRVMLKSTSKRLVEQVQHMLSALGIPSYVTTNKATQVTFANGAYICKESYDINITTGRREFQRQIGFLQGYKQDKLKQACTVAATTKPIKTTYDVVAVEPLGEEEVFDITVESDEHAYWTGGLLVSNCFEIPLHDREACNLSEAFPSRFTTPASQVFNLLARYTLRQKLHVLTDTESDMVNRNNMRIGVGLGGLCDFDWTSDTLQSWYSVVRIESTRYAKELGVPDPITVSCIKPSGTISLLCGSSPGIHAPYAPYYLRRTRIAKNDRMASAMMRAGVPFADCIYDKTGHTWVFSFPTKAKHTRLTVQTESIRDQFERQVAVQENWADNAVSATLTFNQDTERGELERCLKEYVPRLKATSFLPKAHGYAQPPYEEITESVYNDLMKQIDHTSTLQEGWGGDMEVEECQGGACPVR